MLTASEIRKLVRAHNVLSKIKIPRGASVEEMEKIIKENGYSVDHEKKKLFANVKRGKQITLKKAEEVVPAPKKKTASEKAEAKKKKHESVIQYIIKNKEVLEDERIKKMI
jgi:hypothetical protein